MLATSFWKLSDYVKREVYTWLVAIDLHSVRERIMAILQDKQFYPRINYFAKCYLIDNLIYHFCDFCLTLGFDMDV